MKRRRKSGLPSLSAETWETCEICGFAYRVRELREIYHNGHRVKACPACRAKVWQERGKQRREKGEVESSGQLMW